MMLKVNVETTIQKQNKTKNQDRIQIKSLSF